MLSRFWWTPFQPVDGASQHVLPTVPAACFLFWFVSFSHGAFPAHPTTHVLALSRNRKRNQRSRSRARARARYRSALCAFSAFNFGLRCAKSGSKTDLGSSLEPSQFNNLPDTHAHTPTPRHTLAAHTIRLHLFWISRRIKQLSAQNHRVSLASSDPRTRSQYLTALPGTGSANCNRGKNQSDATFALFITVTNFECNPHLGPYQARKP